MVWKGLVVGLLLLLVVTITRSVEAGLRAPRAAAARVAAPRPPASDVIRVHRLELVGADGRTWGELGLSADGSRGLRIFDDAGNLRMEVVVRASGSGVYVHDVRQAAPVSSGTAGQPRPPSDTAPTGPADHSSLSPSSGR